ncbi:MAG: amidohydrolase family protein [Candidatus Binataceae bacterium]
MATSRIVSADSHMMEPPNLWADRLDDRLKDRAPRVVEMEGQSGHMFVAPGLRPFPVAGGFAAGRSGKELVDFVEKAQGYHAERHWDPAQRIKDQEIDGVCAEVLYTTLGMPLFGIEDAELQAACFKAYNDWLAEFCAYDPKRLVGVALVSLEDIADGTRELQRVAKLGLRGAMIWGAAPPDKPFWHRMYDPFWAAAAETGMPISLHLITAGRKGTKPRDENRLRPPDSSFTRPYMNMIHEVQRSFTDIILGGVMMRFPKFKLVSAENDTGWLPHYMYRLDHAFEKWGVQMAEPLEMKPSEYIRRQLWATFQDDPIGPMTWQFFGRDNYMWASDFPHTDSTWPHSQEVIAKNFAGIPEEVTRKIICDNAAKLYGIPLD